MTRTVKQPANLGKLTKRQVEKAVKAAREKRENAPPLPASIRVGYRTFAVGEMDKLEHIKSGAWGSNSLTDGTIKVHLLGNQEEDGNTLIHEVLHCCFRVMDIGDDDKEESAVTKLANALTQVWQDNPDLIAFLDAALGKPGK